jgi:hypothetical protein
MQTEFILTILLFNINRQLQKLLTIYPFCLIYLLDAEDGNIWSHSIQTEISIFKTSNNQQT